MFYSIFILFSLGLLILTYFSLFNATYLVSLEQLLRKKEKK